MEWYRLRVARVRYSIIKKLMDTYDEYEEIFKDNLYKSLKSEDRKKVEDSRGVELEEELLKLEKEGVRVVSLKDEGYPFLLKKIDKPPVFLYIKGRGEFYKNSIGVVGTRKMTSYGRGACEKIVGELLEEEVTIVSGLARGVDGVAHEKTLAKGRYTIAVVGSGLDIIYPPGNRALWERIEKVGTIVSEYPLGTPPMAHNFPARNRIIVGLSRGIVVIESRDKGGSLITAENALDENRDVFAVPGDIFSPSSVGTNNLIRDSRAKLLESGVEILKEYGWNSSIEKNNRNFQVKLSKDEEAIFNALERECNLDELIGTTGIQASQLLAYLMEMELKGLVNGAPGGRYRRKLQV